MGNIFVEARRPDRGSGPIRVSGPIIVVLILLMIVQIGYLYRVGMVATMGGPLVGEQMPTIKAETLDGRAIDIGTVFAEQSTCGVVFVMSTHCPFCTRMRRTWPYIYGQWVGSVGHSVPTIWLLKDDAELTNKWIAGFTLPDVTVATIVRRRDAAWRRLGVIGTPVSYLIGVNGKVQAGVMGPTLPPAKTARAACSRESAT